MADWRVDTVPIFYFQVSVIKTDLEIGYFLS